MKPTVDSVAADLDYMIDAWPLLVSMKIPGSQRSWVETPRRTALTDADKERLGKQGIVRRAPANVGALDLLATIAARADDIARCVVDVAELGHDFLPMESAAKDPRPWFLVISTWIGQAHQRDDLTVPWVADQVRTLTQPTARLLGDVRDGQVMNAVCPWCGGRTASGTGERTLQIHYPSHRTTTDTDDEPLIFCFGIECTPPSSACGSRYQGHPAWTHREWGWLAAQLSTATVKEVV